MVPADFTQKVVSPGERLKQLKGGGLCHPGFSKSQWWNDYILKYFEKTVNRPHCQENITAIESEIRNLKDFFGKACRPGDWAADSSFDQELSKSKDSYSKKNLDKLTLKNIYISQRLLNLTYYILKI